MLDHQTEIDSKTRVLFVDDSRMMRFSARRFLGKDYDLLLAEDGRQAWNMLVADPTIRVVFTDLNMPVMDGHALVRRIRQSPDKRIRALPVLVVTGSDEEPSRRKALDFGADDVISKPFSGDDLADSLRQHLRSPTRRPQPRPRVVATQTLREMHHDTLVRLQQALSFHRRHALELSMLHVRLDNYHAISRVCGEMWSESTLRHIHHILMREARCEDVVCRSASNVFSVILMATPESGVRTLRDRLRQSLSGAAVRFPNRTVGLRVSFSIQGGIARRDGEAETLLEDGLERLNRPANVTPLVERMTG